MRSTRRTTLATILALTMLAAACSSGPAGSVDGADPAAATDAGTAPRATEDGHEDHLDADHDADHDDHGDHDASTGAPDGEPDGGTSDGPPTRPRTTEETLAAIAAMDPERLAGAHDHHDDEHADHDADHAASEVTHPNGIDPERIVIPAIGVDADVIDLGLQDDGAMETPTDFAQAGWFTPGPRPGRVGPAVIAGHVDSRSGPAVFYELTELEVGDEIEVHDDTGEVVTFAVRETEQVPKDAFPTERVYAGTPGPELRLITCGGIFDRSIGHYDDNIIVYADRIDV